MTKQQYINLLKLTSSLMNQYHIQPKNVNFHGRIKNEFTVCPGKHFPYEKFINDLEK
jgi:N-acetyl-anhydromuramyl-L-alanine amidase AmpD